MTDLPKKIELVLVKGRAKKRLLEKKLEDMRFLEESDKPEKMRRKVQLRRKRAKLMWNILEIEKGESDEI